MELIVYAVYFQEKKSLRQSLATRLLETVYVLRDGQSLAVCGL